jgi:hypothetical protein
MPGARKDTTPIAIDTPLYRCRTAALGELTVAFETIHGADDPAPIFKGMPDDRCPCPHWGLVVRGRLTLRYADHEETFEGGDVYYSPAGHLPLASAGTELITFSPTTELEELNAALARNLERFAAMHP